MCVRCDMAGTAVVFAVLVFSASLAAADSGTFKEGRYYTADNLLSVVPPPLESLETKGGADKAIDRRSGYKSYIGWADFSSRTQSPKDTGLFSIEWMNISAGPLKDEQDFYSRAEWYLKNYLRNEYYKRFRAYFDRKEISREKIRVGGHPALQVVLHGPVDKTDYTAGVITIIGIKDIIVNAQVIFPLAENRQDRYRETGPWKQYVTMIESIQLAGGTQE